MLRKLLVFVAVVTSVTVASTAPALADEAMEVSENAAHCPSVSLNTHNGAVTGGCVMKAVGLSIQTYAPSVAGEVLASTCDMTAIIRIDENGTGYGSQVSITGNYPCQLQTNEFEQIEGQSVEMPWGFGLSEEANGTEHATLGLEFLFNGNHVASGFLMLDLNSDNMTVEADGDEIGNSGYELVGHWDLRTADGTAQSDVVITH